MKVIGRSGHAACACAAPGVSAIPSASPTPANSFIAFSSRVARPRSKFPAVLGGHRLRQDDGVGVIALPGPQAEQRLQEAVRYHLVLLVIFEDEAAALVREHRNVG